jgi:hypothetical protein
MENIRNRLDTYYETVRINNFIQNILKFPSNPKYLYNDREILPWIKSLTRDPAIEESTCYISDFLELKMKIDSTPISLQNHGIFDVEPYGYVTEWAFKVINNGNRCSETEEKKIMVLPIVWVKPNDPVAHANVILVDFAKGIYERFEPRMQLSNKIQSPEGKWLDYNESLDTFCRSKLPRIIPFLRSFNYVSPVGTCLRGLQKRRDPGFCMVWSCFITHLRLLFPHRDIADLTNIIIKILSKSDVEDPYIDLVTRYASYMIDFSNA